jgi:hypothetical protein
MEVSQASMAKIARKYLRTIVAPLVAQWQAYTLFMRDKDKVVVHYTVNTSKITNSNENIL